MAGIGDQIKSAGKNVSKVAQEATGAVSEWWDEVNAINRRRGEIRALGHEREQTLVEMGTKVYTLHRHGKVQNRDLLTDCERIDEIGERIDRLEHEIAELKRRSDEAGPREVEVSDDSPVVADEDVDVSVAEAVTGADAEASEAEPKPEPTPETDVESAVPEAHAEEPVEGPEEESAEAPSMEPVPTPEPTPETDSESAMRDAHAQDPTEGPADEPGAVDTTNTEVEPVEPQFGASPEGDASEPEVESEESGRCAHADAAAEGPADEDQPDTRPGCED